jgi:anti-anti-sigma factor
MTAAGRMDALAGLELEKSCHEAIQGNPQVALDLRAVVYMSSAGLRVLLSSLKLATSLNGRFVLIGPRETVLETLEMSGFVRIFQIVDDPSHL